MMTSVKVSSKNERGKKAWTRAAEINKSTDWCSEISGSPSGCRYGAARSLCLRTASRATGHWPIRSKSHGNLCAARVSTRENDPRWGIIRERNKERERDHWWCWWRWWWPRNIRNSSLRSTGALRRWGILRIAKKTGSLSSSVHRGFTFDSEEDALKSRMQSKSLWLTWKGTAALRINACVRERVRVRVLSRDRWHWKPCATAMCALVLLPPSRTAGTRAWLSCGAVGASPRPRASPRCPCC